MHLLHFRVHQLRLDDRRLDDRQQLEHLLVRYRRRQIHLDVRRRQPDVVRQIRYRLDDLHEVHQIRYRLDDLHEVHLLQLVEVRLGQ
jgi:hypothetical protein